MNQPANDGTCRVGGGERFQCRLEASGQDLGIAVQEKQRLAACEARRLIDGRQKADVLRISHDDRAFGSTEKCGRQIGRRVVDDDDLHR